MPNILDGDQENINFIETAGLCNNLGDQEAWKLEQNKISIFYLPSYSQEWGKDLMTFNARFRESNEKLNLKLVKPCKLMGEIPDDIGLLV